MKPTNQKKTTKLTLSNAQMLQMRDAIQGMSAIDPETRRRLVPMSMQLDLVFAKIGKRLRDELEPLEDVRQAQQTNREALAGSEQTEKIKEEVARYDDEWKTALDETSEVELPMIPERLLQGESMGPGPAVLEFFDDLIDFE